MATPAMTGDPVLQRYLSDRYHFYHDQEGRNKSESHSMAFQDMLQAKQQGYVPADETQEPEQPEITDVVYSDEGGL
jgi:hypothetical protein